MRLPISKDDFPKAIYFDQNIWSNLSKAYYSGFKGSIQKPVFNAIIASVFNEKAIYPLSFIHFEEIHQILCLGKRYKLSRFALSISRGLSILNTIFVFQYEIVNAIREKINSVQLIDPPSPVLPYPIRELLILPGVAFVLGIPEVEGAPTDLVQDFYRELMKPRTSLMGLIFPLKNSVGDSLVEGAEKVEAAGKRALKDGISTKTWIKSEVLEFFKAESNAQVILEELKRLGIPKEVFLGLFEKPNDYVDFFNNVHSYSAASYLFIEHHKNTGGKTIKNDLNDVWFLSSAIPYFNGIVMEKHWAAMAKQAGLDKQYDTKIISKINEIPHLLTDLGCI